MEKYLFGFALHPHLSGRGNGSTQYLSSDTIASQQIAGNYSSAVMSSTGHQQVDAQGLRIPATFWSGLSGSNPNKFLLFEGKDEGKGQLVVAFYNSDGTEIGDSPGKWWIW